MTSKYIYLLPKFALLKANNASRGQAVVRDLWALRLQRLSQQIVALDHDTDEEEVFSSQPSGLSEGEQDEGSRTSHWPRVIDSVGLCYLGAVLLRLPVTIADLHR